MCAKLLTGAMLATTVLFSRYTVVVTPMLTDLPHFPNGLFILSVRNFHPGTDKFCNAPVCTPSIKKNWSETDPYDRHQNFDAFVAAGFIINH